MSDKEPYRGLNGFDPYAYAEQWIEDHPECLRRYLESIRYRDGLREKNQAEGTTDA